MIKKNTVKQDCKMSLTHTFWKIVYSSWWINLSTQTWQKICGHTLNILSYIVRVWTSGFILPKHFHRGHQSEKVYSAVIKARAVKNKFTTCSLTCLIYIEEGFYLFSRLIYMKLQRINSVQDSLRHCIFFCIWHTHIFIFMSILRKK